MYISECRLHTDTTILCMEVEQIPGADGLLGWTRRLPKFKGLIFGCKRSLKQSYGLKLWANNPVVRHEKCSRRFRLFCTEPLAEKKPPPRQMDGPDRSRSLEALPRTQITVLAVSMHACTHSSRAGLAWCPDSERIDSARSHVSQDSKCRGHKQHLQRAAKSKLLKARI